MDTVAVAVRTRAKNTTRVNTAEFAYPRTTVRNVNAETKTSKGLTAKQVRRKSVFFFFI